MAFYDEMAGLVVELLTEFGRDAQLSRTIAAGQDTVEGERFGVNQQTLNVKAIDTQFTEAYVPESEILAGDKLVVIDARNQPLKSDKLLDNGATWSIIQIDKKQPALIPLCYILRVRQ